MNCKRSWKNIKFLASQQRRGENTIFDSDEEGNQSIWEKKNSQCYFGVWCFVCFVFFFLRMVSVPHCKLAIFHHHVGEDVGWNFFSFRRVALNMVKGFSPWNFWPRFLGDPGIMIHWVVATQRFLFHVQPKKSGKMNPFEQWKKPGFFELYIRDYTPQLHKE